jgi:hypothetical protein
MTATGSLPVSCEEQPNYAVNYFNASQYYVEGETANYTSADYGGYVTSGYVFQAGLCMAASGVSAFCSTDNVQFFSANQISGNSWNYLQSAGSGTFGFGNNSPVWSIIGSPTTKMFDVYLTNFNAWTWADPTYVATTS